MIATACKSAAVQMGPFIDGTLSAEERAAFEQHLIKCRACQEEVQRFRSVQALLQGALRPGSLDNQFLEDTGKRVRAVSAQSFSDCVELQTPTASAWASFSSMPWWFVSCALHLLLIALASLISMAITLPENNDAVVMITELQPRTALPVEQEKTKPDARDILDKKTADATDKSSHDPSDIIVPPDILAKAELSDHFETINPELPDNHSALGNPEAKMLHSVEGNSDASGGGGMGGLGSDDLIGVGGEASKGTGGGFGGGDGSGIGVGTGAGKGGFGQRTGSGRRLLVRRNGGSVATESAVDAALRWLAYHQEPDGSWQIQKHGGNGNLQDTCCVGVTGLATLAFLGAGHSEKVGQYKENVRKAVEWLMSQQKPDGSIGLNNSNGGWANGSGYNHPIAGMALAEAYAMGRNPKVKEAARQAVYYTTETHWDAQNKIWHYGSAASYHGKFEAMSDNISVVAWFIMQLKSSKIAGLDFDKSVYHDAAAWLDKVMVPGNAGDYASHRYFYQREDKVPTPASTAMALVCRLFMGTPANEVENGAELLVKELPKWNPHNGTTNAPRGPCPHYYWYYGTLVMFQVGGDGWKQWNEALKETLLPHQRKDGDFDGSWDPIGSDGPFAGRAYTTALGALSLEVYYRYLKLNQ
jgi:hypothetical protein